MLDVIHINTYTQKWSLKAGRISRGLSIITKISHTMCKMWDQITSTILHKKMLVKNCSLFRTHTIYMYDGLKYLK